MMLVVEPRATDEVIAVLETEGETVTRIGRVAARDKDPVVFAGKLDLDG